MVLYCDNFLQGNFFLLLKNALFDLIYDGDLLLTLVNHINVVELLDLSCEQSGSAG